MLYAREKAAEVRHIRYAIRQARRRAAGSRLPARSVLLLRRTPALDFAFHFNDSLYFCAGDTAIQHGYGHEA